MRFSFSANRVIISTEKGSCEFERCEEEENLSLLKIEGKQPRKVELPFSSLFEIDPKIPISILSFFESIILDC